MTTKLLAVAFAALTVLSGVVAGVAVTGTAAAAPSDVSSCTVIDEPGQYRLTTDITNESASSCIDIDAENVTFDGNGYTIDGVDGNGTGIHSSTDSVVTDVVVRGFETGALVSSNAEVHDSTFVDNRNGIETYMFDGVIEDSLVTRNVDGLNTSSSEYGTVRDSRIVDNEQEGIDAGIYGEVTIEDSLVADNGETGYDLDDGYVTSVNTTYRNNGGYGINVALGGVYSTNDTVADNAEGGIDTSGRTTLDGTVVENNGGNGVDSRQARMAKSGVAITDSVIRNNDGDGVYVWLPEGESIIHGSVIADNAGLGVNNSGIDVANATGNYWGASDGPASADDEDAPFADPVTGVLANGSGDGVSENASQSGVSNVHFDDYLTENPFTDDGDDGADNGTDGNDSDDGADDGQDDSDDDESNESDDGTSGDDGANDGDDEEESDNSNDGDQGDDSQDGQDTPAYQIDVAAGDVIERLGVDGDDADDAPDFYERQGRLLQAQTVLADGAVTSQFKVPDGEVTTSLNGCMVSYEAVSYDADSGEVTLDVSVADDADCENVTLTLAGYELPGDDTTFVREHADDQELVDSKTVTLASGDDTTVTVDLDG